MKSSSAHILIFEERERNLLQHTSGFTRRERGWTMGRKRKVYAQQDKTNNGCWETTFSKEKTVDSNDMGAKNVGNGNNVKKDSEIKDMVVRRSVRINNRAGSGLPPKSRPIVEHASLVENEAAYSQQVEPQPQQEITPKMNEVSLKEKVDYVVGTADEFKSKFVRQRTNEGPSDFNYKSFNFELRKKLEASVEEYYDLVRKLEFARGKIEAYESMKDALCDQKEVIFFSALAKATEPTANKLAAQLGPTCSAPPPPPPVASILDAPKVSKQKKVRFQL
ncbi:hypothetical protein ACS0TY_012883 [Phlomoides rotata]